MIYTVTFNPAIDYVVHTEKIAMGEINKYSDEKVYFGGKGINVSFILKELGYNSKALGFIAGFTGDAIEKGVQEKGIDTDFVRLEKGFSRINFKIKSGEETELNGKGPEISDADIESLFSKLDAMEDGDVLVLAGSIPACLPDGIYEKILERLSDRNIKAVVDATGKLLLNVLPFKPYLIKPNNFELAEMFNVELETNEDIIKYARELKNMGALNVLVSMAEKGAILVDENDEVHIYPVCKGEVKNSVGAGDSMLAGFLAGMLEKNDYNYALKLGTASGGATAFSDGLATKELIDECIKQL
ncbi:MAG: 1-phosphofructokinase [Ruminococcaceae bacterium]|nr:1-phosphofructokinase [Oscillospiraceae bacterium]